jgi:hypothetical protein
MIGTDQDQGMPSVDSSKERGEDDAKGKEETPPATRKKKGKGASAADGESESYIHVRARKGQATNRHSLAERVGTVHTDLICCKYIWCSWNVQATGHLNGLALALENSPEE